MNRACKQCGCALQRSATTSLYCFSCSHARAKAPIRADGRMRQVATKPAKQHGVWVCLDCSGPVQQIVTNGRRCRPPLRCKACRSMRNLFTTLLSGRQAACTEVARARKSGRLADPSTLCCADCGKSAECYDHRDYGAPLVVDPVCRSCNVMRGHAKPVHPFFVLTALALLAPSVPAPAEQGA